MKMHRYIHSALESTTKTLMRVSLIAVAGLSIPALGQEANLVGLELQPTLNELELHQIQGQGAHFRPPELQPVYIILWDESGQKSNKPQRNGNITVQMTIGNES